MSKHIVILGAGYAGLRAFHELQKEKKDIQITLVDQNDYHFEATDIHEVAAGIQTSERITYPIREVIKKDFATFIQATVISIDREKNLVYLKDEKTLSYDYLIVALGYESESFGISGVKEFSLEMVDIPTSEKIHTHLMEQMKAYKQTSDERYLKIVVCGAGFTGIELLGSLVEGRKKLAKIAGVSSEKIELICIEAVTKLLPMFSEKLGNYGINHLKKWGVTFLVGKPIQEVQKDKVIYLNDATTKELVELEAKTIIWTTGVSGSHIVTDSGFQAKRGRVAVQSDLTDEQAKNVYVIGDCSAVMDPQTNRPYPTTAQIALKMGEHAGKNIRAQLRGEPTKAFTFKSLGSVASIGNSHAFGLVGEIEVSGYPASLIKKFIMDRSLFQTGGTKEMLAKGRFDFYH